MREAPSLVVVKGLLDRGATVCAYDPIAMPEGASKHERLGGRSRFADSGSAATKEPMHWSSSPNGRSFAALILHALRSDLKHPVIFDGRNLFDPALVKEAGLEYFCVGRSSARRAGK